MENKHVSEELADWQQIQSPFSTISAKMIDENNSSVIRDDFFSESSVFPPGNHEDLPVSATGDDHLCLEEPGPIHAPSVDGVRRWRRLCLGVMQTGISVVGRFRNSVTCKIGFWSFACIAGGVVAMLVSFLRARAMIWWQRLMHLNGSRENLMALIREKDKKIDQLLLQIAQINEVLLTRRRVPVIRVK